MIDFTKNLSNLKKTSLIPPIKKHSSFEIEEKKLQPYRKTSLWEGDRTIFHISTRNVHSSNPRRPFFWKLLQRELRWLFKSLFYFVQIWQIFFFWRTYSYPLRVIFFVHFPLFISILKLCFGPVKLNLPLWVLELFLARMN